MESLFPETNSQSPLKMLGFPSSDSPNFQEAKILVSGRNLHFWETKATYPTTGNSEHHPFEVPLDGIPLVSSFGYIFGFYTNKINKMGIGWDWKHQISWTFSLACRELFAPRGPATPWRPCRLAGAWAEESAPSPRCVAVGVRRCTGARWEFWEVVGEGVGWWGWLIWIEMIYMYTYITYFVEEPKIWIYIYTNDVCIDILFKVAVRCESFQILEMAWWTLKKNEVRSKVSVFLICLTCLFFLSMN